MRTLVLAVPLLLAAAQPAAPALAQEVLFTLTGPDGNLLQVTDADLAELPSHREHVAFQTGKGEEAADYEGVSLWELLVQASAVPLGPPKNHIPLVARVTGRDGWTAAVAVAEFDPDFEAKDVLLGHRISAEGTPVGELRLVVPGDRHGARDVRDVASIEVH